MLPYGKQTIDDDDIAAVVETLRSDFLTTGPKVQEFERDLCQLTGAKESIVCANGTAALHLAALALGLGEGDAVIVPSLTFLATANAVRYCGAEVIFSDVNPDTGLMEAVHLEEALNRAEDLNVKAVFVVHLAGKPVDLRAMRKIADRNDIKLVADACHAIGGTYDDRPIGACELEDMSVFSFHPVKTIAMGEGGAITTNHTPWAQKMRTLRSHSMDKKPEAGPWFYEASDLGFNYRASDIHCALGISQLKKLDRFVKRRQEIVELYNRLLSPLFPFILPPKYVGEADPAWHLYAVRIDFKAIGLSREDVMLRLKNLGVGTQVHYIPVHSQPYYARRYPNLSLPGSAHYYARTLSLPLYPDLRDEDVYTVVDALKNILEKTA